MRWIIFTVKDDKPRKHGVFWSRDDADDAAVRLQDRGIIHGMCPEDEWELHQKQENPTSP
jgi:hypothetical protein